MDNTTNAKPFDEQDTKSALEYIQAWQQSQPKVATTCPSCGYCHHCGRGGHSVGPWVVPMPYYPPQYPTYPTYLTGI